MRMKISIIGAGWVGTAVGKGLAELGNEVIYHDIVDKDLPNFTKDINHAIDNSDVSFISVPTPTTENGEIELSYIKEVSKSIGEAMALKQSYHLVVVKSTVVPGTTETVVIPTLEEYSGKKAGEFGICMNPEFLTEISETWSKDTGTKKEFSTEDRIVIGEYDKKSGDALEELYTPLGKPIFRTNLKTAELIKYASNCMLATKISYWNEICLICERVGIDSEKVADIVAQDPRIGKYGTVHGKAFGGTCLPKDLKAFVSFAERYKEAKLLKSLGEILSIKLIEKLREEESGVYGVGARGSISKFPYGSFNFTISFPCGPENVIKLKDAALAEVQSIIDNGPLEKDVAKIKEAQLLEYKENLKKNRYWINSLKNADYNKKDKSKIIGLTKEIDDISAIAIQNIAKKYLSNGHILAILYPENQE